MNIKKAAAMLAVVLAIAGWVAYKLTHPVIDSTANVEIQKSKVEKIHFQVFGRTRITTADLGLLEKTHDYSNTVMKIVKQDGHDANSLRTLSGGKEITSELYAAKRAYWASIRTQYPELHLPDYSNNALSHFLAWDLPRRMAPYGILAKPMTQLIVTPSTEKFEVCEVVLKFGKVSKIITDKVMIRGARLDRDVLIVTADSKVDSLDLGDAAVNDSTGQTFFQNIFIFEDNWNEEAADKPTAQLLENIALLKGLSPQNVADLINRSDDTELAAYQMAGFMTLAKWVSTTQTKDQVLKDVVAHETGHLYDQQDPSYRSFSITEPTKDSIEYLRFEANLQAHEEISGFLAELAGSPLRVRTISLACQSFDKDLASEVTHSLALRWIAETYAEEIEDNPGLYTQLRPYPGLDQRHQAILGIADLTESQIVAIAQKISDSKRPSYSTDFSGPYLEAIKNKIRQAGG